MATETPASLRALIDERRGAGRPVTVHVEIAPQGAEMSVVAAVAETVAERIAGDDGAVVEDGDVGDGEVWLTYYWGGREQLSPPRGVRDRATYTAGTVLVAPAHAVPSTTEKALDARVRVADDAIEAAYAVRHQPFEDRTLLHEFDDDGLKVDDWWDCPSCGAETTTAGDPPPHRACTSCEWSETIPTPGEVNDGDW